MTNVREILDKARAVGARLSPSEASVLFASAVRHAAAQGATLRPHLVQIDDTGAVHVAPFDDRAPETDAGYLAPELQGADAPKRTEERVQVFAAGALGYELFTGRRPAGRPPGPELTGPLTDVIRVAMASDRNERFPDLRRLQDAIEVLQPRPPAEGERSILSALRMRAARVAPEKEALAKLIDKVHQIEEQVQLLGKAQTRLEAAQRETSEHLERFTEGQSRLGKGKQQGPSMLGPVLVAAIVAVLGTIGVVWAMGNLGPKPAPLPPPQHTEAQADAAVPEPPPKAEPTPAAKEAAPRPPKEAAAPAPKESAAPAPLDAGPAAALPDASIDATAETDAGAPDASAAAAESPPPPPPPKSEPAPAPRKRVSPQAAMQHALATTAVRRGEAALEQNRAADALESFRAALETEPNNADAFRGIGMAYAMQGNNQQALEAYAKYLRLAPNASDARDIRRSMSELRARSKVGGAEK